MFRVPARLRTPLLPRLQPRLQPRTPFVLRAWAAILLALGTGLAFAAEEENRWEQQIAAFEAADRTDPPAQGQLLFVGSSSIRLWDLAQSFPEWQTINRGFGGSETADLITFADRIVIPYRPRAIFVYAGDNDIARGKTPERVAADFRQFAEHVQSTLPGTPIFYIAIKPSLARWQLFEQMRDANRRIRTWAETEPWLHFVDIEATTLGPDGQPRKDFFAEDGLHLNNRGYAAWTDVVRRTAGPVLATHER